MTARTAFDDGRWPRRPGWNEWLSKEPGPDLEDVRVAWEYATGSALPSIDQGLVASLRGFTVDALMWVAGNPAVRSKEGTLAAVHEAHRQLIKQSAAALAAKREQDRAEARRKAAAQDAEDADRRRGRSHKESGWRMGRSPGSYGGGRMS